MSSESIIIRAALHDRQFKHGMKGMKRSVGEFSSQFNRALGLVGAGVSAGALVNFSKGALQLADDLGTAAATIGVTTDELQEFTYAAEQNGIATDKAQMGLQRFARRLAQAQQGGGELLPMLKQLNVAMFNTDGSARSTNAVLNDYADALMGIEDPQARLLAGFKAFDSEGAQLIAMLGKGSEALQEYRHQAHAAGAVLEKRFIQDLDAADKSLKRFTQRGRIAFASFLGGAIRYFKIGQHAAQEFFETLFLEPGKLVEGAGQLMMSWLDMLGDNIKVVGRALKHLFSLEFDAAAAQLEDLKLVPQEMHRLMADSVKQIDTLQAKQLANSERQLAVDQQRVNALSDQTKAMEDQERLRKKMEDNRKKLAEKRIQRGRLSEEQLEAIDPTEIKGRSLARQIRAQQLNLQLAKRHEAYARFLQSQGQTENAAGYFVQSERRRRNLTLLQDKFRGPNFDLLQELNQAGANLAPNVAPAGQRLTPNANAAAPTRQAGSKLDQIEKHLAAIHKAATPEGPGLKTTLYYPTE